MTIIASGSLTGAELHSELRQTGGNLVFPSATTRWLAEKPTGNLILPTDFYSKSAVKMVDNFNMIGGPSTVFSRTSSFGPEFPGRAIVLAVTGLGPGGTLLTFSSIVFNGTGMVMRGGWTSQNASIAVSSGIADGAPTGTSGTTTFTFDTAATNVFGYIFSVANIPSLTATSSNGGFQVGATTSATIGANGVYFVIGFQSNYAGDITMIGVTERFDSSIGGGVRYAVGWRNRQSPSSGPVGFSAASGDMAGTAVASYGG